MKGLDACYTRINLYLKKYQFLNYHQITISSLNGRHFYMYTLIKQFVEPRKKIVTQESNCEEIDYHELERKILKLRKIYLNQENFLGSRIFLSWLKMISFFKIIFFREIN